jgi:hypothetical protein
MRTILLSGDFLSGRIDHQWQVIPTAWVKAAQAKWTQTPPQNCPMTAIGADIAQGGADDMVLSPRHGPWFAELIITPGVLVPKPSQSAGIIVANRRNNAVIVVDMGGGYGGGVKERLEDNDIAVRPYNGANESIERTNDKQLKFVNKRAEIHWRMREALDPDQDGGSAIALPPDPMLLADLTAPRWKLTTQGIQVESKDDLKKAERLGRSPDRGDAAMMSWSEGEKAIVARIKKAEKRKLPELPNVIGSERSGDGWMAV